MSFGKRPTQITKGQRLNNMARKRDERAARKVYRHERQMESYLADDANYGGFSSQLAKLGLQLRDIPGDGNCLFRALGDQLEGHIRNHLKHRLMVVKFMEEHREDFEPFVEDDIPFERHIASLKKAGTYAGNDAIVAFAKLNKVNIVIHQLNLPVWTIRGTDLVGGRELHISYHNGDHYSSVRRLGDTSEAPASIKLTAKEATVNGKQNNGFSQNSQQNYYNGSATSYSTASAGYDSDYDNVPSEPHVNGETMGIARAYRDLHSVEEAVIRATGCMDVDLVCKTLKDVFYDPDTAIRILLSIPHNQRTDGTRDQDGAVPESSQHTAASGIWSENGTGSRIFPSGTGVTGKGARPKLKQLTGKEKKKQKKLEKQLRAQERHRLKVSGMLPAPDYDDEEDYAVDHVVANGLRTLHI